MNFEKEKLVKSPLNYTGGKFKLLPQILPLIPEDINVFVDLFGGGCNVGVNTNAKKVIYNDKQYQVARLFEGLYNTPLDKTVRLIEETISKYNNMSTKEDYNNLRKDYNLNKEWYKLLVISSYAFNFNLRFNGKGEVNASSGVGSSSFNESIRKRLLEYTKHIHKLDMEFYDKDFRDIDLSNLTSMDLVYVDPPYLISTASYNENRGIGGWNGDSEEDLYKLLDYLNENNVRFALSNVIAHKGNVNEKLIEWAEKYNTYMLNMKYDNGWRSTRKVDEVPKETIEVLITNYQV